MKCQIASVLSSLLLASSAQAEEASTQPVAQPAHAPVNVAKSNAPSNRNLRYLTAKRSQRESEANEE